MSCLGDIGAVKIGAAMAGVADALLNARRHTLAVVGIATIISWRLPLLIFLHASRRCIGGLLIHALVMPCRSIWQRRTLEKARALGEEIRR